MIQTNLSKKNFILIAIFMSLFFNNCFGKSIDPDLTKVHEEMMNHIDNMTVPGIDKIS